MTDVSVGDGNNISVATIQNILWFRNHLQTGMWKSTLLK